MAHGFLPASKTGSAAPPCRRHRRTAPLCFTSMSGGPEAAKSFPGQAGVRLSPAGAAAATQYGAGCAQQAVDCGRRSQGSTCGAFRPAPSAACTHPCAGRTRGYWTEFLERITAWVPAAADQVEGMGDNARTPRTIEVLIRTASSVLGVRSSAQVSDLPERDRIVVDDPPLCGRDRPSPRDVGGVGRGGQAGNRVREQAPASMALGGHRPRRPPGIARMPGV